MWPLPNFQQIPSRQFPLLVAWGFTIPPPPPSPPLSKLSERGLFTLNAVTFNKKTHKKTRKKCQWVDLKQRWMWMWSRSVRPSTPTLWSDSETEKQKCNLIAGGILLLSSLPSQTSSSDRVSPGSSVHKKENLHTRPVNKNTLFALWLVTSWLYSRWGVGGTWRNEANPTPWLTRTQISASESFRATRAPFTGLRPPSPAVKQRTSPTTCKQKALVGQQVHTQPLQTRALENFRQALVVSEHLALGQLETPDPLTHFMETRGPPSDV